MLVMTGDNIVGGQESLKSLRITSIGAGRLRGRPMITGTH